MRRLLHLQHLQTEEHHQIVKEVRQARKRMTSEMSDVIFRLSAVTDRLEEQLQRGSNDE